MAPSKVAKAGKATKGGKAAKAIVKAEDGNEGNEAAVPTAAATGSSPPTVTPTKRTPPPPPKKKVPKAPVAEGGAEGSDAPTDGADPAAEDKPRRPRVHIITGVTFEDAIKAVDPTLKPRDFLKVFFDTAAVLIRSAIKKNPEALENGINLNFPPFDGHKSTLQLTFKKKPAMRPRVNIKFHASYKQGSKQNNVAKASDDELMYAENTWYHKIFAGADEAATESTEAVVVAQEVEGNHEVDARPEGETEGETEGEVQLETEDSDTSL
ncbi:hypothetical protein HYH02_015183 [Chlamydomonas schloesseri]|uniref:Uncharacterized protein n=1 Tax=Chlamydomonas schloesseri TaxID=2026947 RepID=A0A835SIY3_9CHLO|nr:hypothetical protein HYH02_015183 [Chlamydomonas schloesseri]|eukprot:KAG2424323.1 hypothetical protein HYH02_015183 [Chlamydomonas schloesseri]